MVESLADVVPQWAAKGLFQLAIYLGIAAAFLALGMSRSPRVEHHYHSNSADNLAHHAIEAVSK